MILRRITEHVKTQNWFAVWVEFVIVVFGVFAGLQVQEWQTAREFDAMERAYLVELREEILRNNVYNEGRREQIAVIIEAGERAANSLGAGASCEADCKSNVVDHFIASQVMFSPAFAAVYEEMQRLGLPRSDAVKAALARFYSAHNGMRAAYENSRPEYRVRLRGHLTPSAQRVLWRNCVGLENGVETYNPQCTLDISEAEAREIAQRIHADTELPGLLNYWIGMNILWEPLLQELIGNGEAAIAAIDAELGAEH